MCPNFDKEKMASAWGIGFTPQAIVQNYSLITHWKKMRAQHTDFMCRLVKVSSDENLEAISEMVEKINSGNLQPPAPDEVLAMTAPVYNVVFAGVKLLQGWTSHIIEMTSWKFVHTGEAT